MCEEDNSIFLSAMQGVKPLKTKSKTTAEASTKPKTDSQQLLKQIKKKQFNKRAHDDHAFNFTEDGEQVSAFERLSYSQPGVRQQELNNLKKSNFALYDELDLHGLTKAQAQPKIKQFLSRCLSDHARFIRIIHGKGYNSGELYPVLKNLTYQMLKAENSVIAFQSAPEKDGGVGAVNILLKA